MYGWMKSATTGGIYTLDFWRCDNFNPASPTSAGMVWNQMNWSQVSQVSSIEGNPSVYNQWIIANQVGGSANGWQYYGPTSVTW